MNCRRELVQLVLALVVLLACCNRSLASQAGQSENFFEQFVRELYGDGNGQQQEVTTVMPRHLYQPIFREASRTEDHAARQSARDPNDRPLDDDQGNFLPDDLSAEEISAIFERREARERAAATAPATVTSTRRPESLRDKQVREANERAARERRERDELRRREEAQRREARERSRYSSSDRQRYMEETFGRGVDSEEAVQRIAEQLLRQQENQEIEASKRLPTDYRHLDADSAFDAAVAKAEQYQPKSKDEECRICLEPLHDGPSIKLACGDAFHSLCIKRWIGAQKANLKDCPTCRRPVKL